MLFSIVIPTYNRARFIETTIYSVLAQTYPDFEIIVVDDGSTDDTEAVLATIPDKRITYYKKQNEERAAARNYGTLRARGQYITYLDSDDILLPDFLKEATGMVARENNPEWFHLRYKITDDQDHILVQERIYTSEDPNIRLFSEGNFLSCIGVFLRHDIAPQFLFNADRAITTSEDHELWARVAIKYPIRMNQVVCAKLIQHNSRSVVAINKNNLISGKELTLSLILGYADTIPHLKRIRYKIKSASYSYISLHLALSGRYKAETITYMFKALRYNPQFLFTRRFLATIKHLLFTF